MLSLAQEFGFVAVSKVYCSEPGREDAPRVCVWKIARMQRPSCVATAKAGAQSLALAGRLLGGLGAGLAVGVAAHGWSTTKPMQTLGSCGTVETWLLLQSNRIDSMLGHSQEPQLWPK